MAEHLGERSDVAVLTELCSVKERWNPTSLSRGPAARIASHPSRYLLHLVIRTLEAPPNCGADRIMNRDGPNGSGSV